MRTFFLDRKGGVSALFLGLGLSLSLVACGDDSSSTNVDSSSADQPESSVSKDDPEQSSSSVAVDCTEKLEGETRLVWDGNEKYGAGHYEKCSDGKWDKIPTTEVLCPKEPSVGDSCSVDEPRGFFYRSEPDIYVYTEDGTWLYVDPKACSASREGEVVVDDYYENYHYSYKICRSEKWADISFDDLVEMEVKKFPKKASDGDTAVIEILDRSYVFADGEWKLLSNVEDIEDACSMDLDKETRHSNVINYVCRGKYGEWVQYDEPTEVTEAAEKFLWNGQATADTLSPILFFDVDDFNGENGGKVVTSFSASDESIDESIEANKGLKYTVSAVDGVEGGVSAVAFNVASGAVDMTKWKGLCLAYKSNQAFKVSLNANSYYDNDAFGFHYDDQRLEIYSATVPENKKVGVVNLDWDSLEPYSGKKVDLGLEKTLSMVTAVQIVVEHVGETPAEVFIEKIGSFGQCE